MKHTRYYIVPLVLLCLINAAGCKKFIEPEMPIDKTAASEVYKSLPTAVAAITGILATLSTSYDGNYTGRGGISISTALMADELAPRIAGSDRTYLNDITGDEGFTIWNSSYRLLIYRCNAAIRGLEESKGIPDNAKRILIGEVKFIRAWVYFNLVNYYGDVPLITVPDFRVGQHIARSAAGRVYEQIERDLLDAQAGLNNGYMHLDMLSPTQERIRPNKATATALLARVYLFMERWAEAEAEATKVISNEMDYALLPLNDIFLKNSREAIWQLQPSPVGLSAENGTNTEEGKAFLNTDNIPGNSYYKTSPFLLDAFETGDQRAIQWFTTSGGFIMPYKYKMGHGFNNQEQKEYAMAFRLSEQYLIRAEARARQNNIAGANSAESDLNAIRGRAGLGEFKTNAQQAMLDAIMRERYVELCIEWGDRWMTLKRLGKLDARMVQVAPVKQAIWQPFKALLPIPYSEFVTNTALRGHQNQGYLEKY